MYRINEVISEKYKIIKSLGVGERAVIYLARDLKSNQKVVIKFFTQANNKENISHINLTRPINIEEIVDIIDVDYYGGKIYYVMPFKPCTSLYSLLNIYKPEPIIKGQKSINTVLNFFKNFINFMTEHKICWQIHPRHIMVMPNRKIFFTSLAYPLDEIKGVYFSDLTMGLSDECFPPEILDNKYCNPVNYYQYTVSATILSMLTGQPYLEKSKEIMLSKIPGKGNKTRAALRKALNNNIANRFHSYLEFYKMAKSSSLIDLFSFDS